MQQARRLKFKNQVILKKIIWEYGGTGRRAGFKIRSLWWCGFDSLYSYQQKLAFIFLKYRSDTHTHF